MFYRLSLFQDHTPTSTHSIPNHTPTSTNSIPNHTTTNTHPIPVNALTVCTAYFALWIRNISVGTLTRLGGAPPSKRCSIPGKDSRFLSSLEVCTRLWGPPGYSMGIGALSPCLKRPGHQADPSPPNSAEVRNQWSCMFISPYAIMTYTKATLTDVKCN